MVEKKAEFDVVIVGSGPAGMAAALWCDELKLSACLIERRFDPGGQLQWIHNAITNYPGASFANGSECLRAFKGSLSDRNITVITDARVTGINVEVRSVTIAGREAIQARYLILATGVRRRRLEVPGEEEYRGRGILESGSRDKAEASGKRVAVIGGGDAALENALILAEKAERVFLIHRGERFSARSEFVRAVAKNDRIEAVLGSRVREFGGSEKLEFVDIDCGQAGSKRIAVERAVVRIGVQPNTELLAGAIATDAAAYVVTDRLGQTSRPYVYAIGDVAFPEAPTIASAVGSAAAAIKSIAAKVPFSE